MRRHLFREDTSSYLASDHSCDHENVTSPSRDNDVTLTSSSPLKLDLALKPKRPTRVTNIKDLILKSGPPSVKVHLGL